MARGAAVLVLGAALAAGPAEGRMRPLTDAEMDNVCAKGSVGYAIDEASVRQMVFEFAHQSALAGVAGSVVWTIEAVTPNPGQVQVRVGNQTIAPGAPVALAELDTIHIQAVDAQVRVTGDVNLSITPSAAFSRTLGKHQELLDSLNRGGHLPHPGHPGR